MADDRRHYYLFSFVGGNPGTSGLSYARVTMGWPGAKITESRIQEAKVAAYRSDKQDACPLAVSYLGYMTPEEAKA